MIESMPWHLPWSGVGTFLLPSENGHLGTYLGGSACPRHYGVYVDNCDTSNTYVVILCNLLRVLTVVGLVDPHLRQRRIRRDTTRDVHKLSADIRVVHQKTAEDGK